MRFRGRIGGRLLRAGIYTIVPAVARAARLQGPRVAIMIDARGVHPIARVPDDICGSTATTTEPLLPALPRYAGVAGAIATGPASRTGAPTPRADRSVDEPSHFHARILPSAGRNWLTVAVLMSLLASITLLGLAAVEPRYTRRRFPLVRAIEAHREQVAFSGAAFLVAAGVLLLLARLPM